MNGKKTECLFKIIFMKRTDSSRRTEKRQGTRHYHTEDTEGQVKGTNQANLNEKRMREAEDNDKSDLNKWDSRDEIHDTQRNDL
jgi:hypothetical protein